MTEDELDQVIVEVNDHVDEVGCDTRRFTAAESIEFYQGIRDNAAQWIETLKDEALFKRVKKENGL
jgi:hypothetical protein